MITFWSNCVGNSPSRKWLVNHCPLSHFAHGELAGLGTHWVVAVLNDSCGAECLKLSSNVWHMVCVSLWPVTLVALNSPVASDWLSKRWGTGKGQSMNLLAGNNTVWATLLPNGSNKLVKITLTIPCTCVITEWKCLIIATSFTIINRMKVVHQS